MMVSFSAFKGELPQLHKRNLPDDAAQIAVNARLDDGALTPIAASSFVSDLGAPSQTLYLHGATWLTWPTHVHVVPGPTATDRLYVTGDGVPKMYANDTWYNLALQPPAAGPVIENVGDPDPDLIETTVYAYTFVTSFGEESAPSPLSDPLETSEGVVVRLTAMEAPPAGRGIEKLRIYRSVTGLDGSTDLYFVSEIPIQASYDHDLAVEPANEPVPTLGFSTPPDDLRGVISMPNGMMVGHTAREIHFCEPYQPHAWPVKYSLTVDYDIVGIAAFGSQIAVMTTGTPYRGQGYHPESFSLERIEENLPCVSARGIVDLGYAAAYPSTEGLVTITSSGAQVITRGLFSRRDWAKLNPQSFVATRYDDRYLFGFTGSHGGAGEKTGLIELTGSPFFLRSDVQLRCAYNDIRTARVYFQDADNRLYIFDDTDNDGFLPLKWRSKFLDLGFFNSFSVLRVEGTELAADSGFICRVYADGALIHTMNSLNYAGRLPAISARHWEVEIEGTVEVTAVTLADSMEELAGRP